MTHDHIIDLVARQMTEAEPPADLRARVIAALPPTRRPRWIRMTIPAGAIAALAIIALMSGTVWLERSNGPAVQGSKGPDAATTTRVVAPAVAEASAGATTGPLDRWTVGPLDRVDVPLPSRVAPLEEVVPLSIEPIQPIGVSIAPITVTPLVTEPLVVPALDARSGGRE